MTGLSLHVSYALILRKPRERAAGARGQVNETAVLKEEQAGGLAAPPPTPAVTGWAAREGARGNSPGQQHWHSGEEGGASGRCVVPCVVS